MSQLDRPEVSVGLYSIHLGNTAEINGDSFQADEKWQAVPHLYYVQPVNEKIRLGFGLNSPFGLGIEWEDDVPFRASGTRSLIRYISASSVMSYKLSDQLSLGVGLSLNYMDAELRQGIVAEGDEFRFDGDDTAPGWSLAMHWTPHEQHAFGLTYRSQTSFDLEGETSTRFLSPAGIVNQSESAELELLTPEVITIGYSYRPTKKWNIEANIDWVRWDTLGVSRLSQDSGDLLIPFNWASSFIYTLGATYYFENGYAVSAGYNYNESSIPTDNFSPLVVDADRHWINFGLSKSTDHWDWALAYQYGFSNKSVSLDPSNAAASSLSGRYKSDHHAVVFSLQRKF